MIDIVERLRSGAKHQTLVTTGLVNQAAKEITRLTSRVEELEVEVEAAKKFDGGFYGEAVEEGTREVYRGFARSAITQEKRDE